MHRGDLNIVSDSSLCVVCIPPESVPRQRNNCVFHRSSYFFGQLHRKSPPSLFMIFKMLTKSVTFSPSPTYLGFREEETIRRSIQERNGRT